MRKKYLFTSLVVAILLFYLGFTFYARRHHDRDLAQRLEERTRDQQSQVVEAYRGTELKIVSFYAYPAAISKGQSAQLCYGVINSEKLRTEPPVENVWPAVSNCVKVMPKKTTRYKLIAEDAKGKTIESDTTVEVF